MVGRPVRACAAAANSLRALSGGPAPGLPARRRTAPSHALRTANLPGDEIGSAIPATARTTDGETRWLFGLPEVLARWRLGTANGGAGRNLVQGIPDPRRSCKCGTGALPITVRYAAVRSLAGFSARVHCRNPGKKFGCDAERCPETTLHVPSTMSSMSLLAGEYC